MLTLIAVQPAPAAALLNLFSRHFKGPAFHCSVGVIDSGLAAGLLDSSVTMHHTAFVFAPPGALFFILTECGCEQIQSTVAQLVPAPCMHYPAEVIIPRHQQQKI
jgi:hypothetical protein